MHTRARLNVAEGGKLICAGLTDLSVESYDLRPSELLAIPFPRTTETSLVPSSDTPSALHN